MAKEEKFGDLASLDARFRDANNWVSPICSYNSTLLPTKTEGKELTFRRDPNAYFGEISSQLIKMLLQDLTVIFDEMMSEALIKLKLQAGDMPQSKVEKLATLVSAEYKWANQGCLELIAVRNSLCHANGRWNEKSLKIIEGFVKPLPAVGDEIIVGFEMLFNYRKAMRTFLNDACPPDPKPKAIKTKTKALRSKRSEARSLKERRKALVREVMQPT
jgi:hypothetical protein